MRFVADTHVHIYSCYDLDAVFRAAFKNLDRLAPGRDDLFRAIFLTERSDCHFFKQLTEGSLVSPGRAFAIKPGPEANVVLVRDAAGNELHVFAGRQIATRERLEVLSLMSDADIDDDGSFRDVVNRVLSCGGLPVVPWAPGKWFGTRGDRVSGLVDSMPSGKLMIGDSSLRSWGWPEPSIMRRAAGKGMAVLAGTDPFPFKGQESQIGQYGVTGDVDFDKRKPVSELRRLFSGGGLSLARVGNRNGPGMMMQRLVMNALGSGS